MSADASKAETVVAYAALILADEGLEITPEKLQTLISAAKIEDIEPIWTTLFAKALQRKDVKDILTKVTTSTQEVGQKKVFVDGHINDTPDQGEVNDGEDIQDDSDDGEAFLSLFD